MTVRTAGSLDPLMEDVLATDIERWPLLIRSLKTTGQAEHTKIEWLVHEDTTCPACGTEHVRRVQKVEHNFTEIFRTPVRKDESTFDALKRHCDEIERALRSGIRKFDTTGAFPRGFMGGVIHLLGRWPHKDDFLSIKFLRKPFIMPDELDSYGVPRDIPRKEWISELSLIAVKGTS